MEKISIVSIVMKKDKELEGKFSKKISSPKDVVSVITEFLSDKDREYFVVITLNTKNYINEINVVSIGTLNSSLVHPREVFKAAILSNAASIIIAHNHPSGDTKPSKEDINITYRIKESGKILGIELLDHIIIGDNNSISFKEEGII